MPIHDWTRVEAGLFHALHMGWLGQLQNALNEGLLPEGYYALAEQHAGGFIADVLMLHASPPPLEPLPPPPPATGGLVLAEAPPQVRNKHVIDPVTIARRRSLAIRHISGHRLIALVEIISPANKDRTATVADFVTKAQSALDRGVHLLLVDLFPPGLHDPQGMNGALLRCLEPDEEPPKCPDEAPLTLAAYAAGPRIEIYSENVAVGATLPEMPLFVRYDRYIKTPLEATYQTAYRGMPAFWREVLEESSGATGAGDGGSSR